MIRVQKAGMQLIMGANKSQTKQILKDLTLTNPTYVQAKKYSRSGLTAINPYLFHYRKLPEGILVPRGYKVLYEHKVVRDDRIKVRALYPKFKLDLRETQQEAFDAWHSNGEDGLIVMQTGKGKSILGCYLASKMNQKTLVIVQKNDLVDGWTEDIHFSLGIPKHRIGLIKAKKRQIGRHITLCTIQTLKKLPIEELVTLYNTFGMIIVDEVHHSPASSYKVLEYFQARYLVGLTATDDREDGLRKVMDWQFGGVCFRAEEKGEADEDIMPYSVIIRNSDVVYEPEPIFIYKGTRIKPQEAYYLMDIGEKVKRVPLDTHERAKVIIEDEDFNNQVATDIYKEFKARKSCIAFIHEKEHIRDMEARLIAKGVPEEQIQLYYGDSKEKDSVMKKNAESKDVLITLATFSKATEGTNVKAWERGFLVTSVNNEKNVIQAVGRCRRKKEGKRDVIIYDYRHPKVMGMKKHGTTRDKAYRRTKGKLIIAQNTPIFTRGFRRK